MLAAGGFFGVYAGVWHDNTGVSRRVSIFDISFKSIIKILALLGCCQGS